MLADRYRNGEVDDRVWVYAAGGYYEPGKDLAALQAEMRGYLAMGYTTVKMKIGGASLDEDLRRIEAVLEVVDGTASRLAVDANGRFDLETALAYADAGAVWAALVRGGGRPARLRAAGTAGRGLSQYPGDRENLFSVQDARNLIRYGGMRPDRDVLQFDCALSYGLVEYLRILDMLDEHGWSRRTVVPHGGHRSRSTWLPGWGWAGTSRTPASSSPSSGFADTVPVENGYVALPDAPGIGFELKAPLYAVMRELAA